MTEKTVINIDDVPLREQAAPFPDARRTWGKGKQRLHVVLLQ
jgi:hypothetical protein